MVCFYSHLSTHSGCCPCEKQSRGKTLFLSFWGKVKSKRLCHVRSPNMHWDGHSSGSCLHRCCETEQSWQMYPKLEIEYRKCLLTCRIQVRWESFVLSLRRWFLVVLCLLSPCHWHISVWQNCDWNSLCWKKKIWLNPGLAQCFSTFSCITFSCERRHLVFLFLEFHFWTVYVACI